MINERSTLNDEQFDIPGLSEAVDRKIQQWKERLIDLGLRNRLINFKETKASTLKIVEPNAAEIYEHIIKTEGDYYLNVQEEQGFLISAETEGEVPDINAPAINVRDSNELVCEGTRERTARVLYTLRSRAQTEFEERGIHVLFLAMGFLSWNESAASSIYFSSPLILIPIQLERQRSRQRYKLSIASEEVIINPALATKLKNDFGIILPELPESPEELDPEAFLHQINTAVSNKPTWKINMDCYLGLFSFLKFMMYKDLEANKEAAKKNRVIGALAGFNSLLPDNSPYLVTADKLDYSIKPEHALQIIDADSSQQEAIVAALANMSFVLQGPPGTGKSQTIVNIIAECLFAGKRILFVSEKMAALEVVKRRLDKYGLGEFCLELHSHKSNKRAVMEQLEDTLRQTQGLQIQEERVLFYELEERRNRLNSYVKALHKLHMPLEVTVFQVNGRLARLWETPDISVSIPGPLQITQPQLGQIKRTFGQIVSHASIYDECTSHPWKGSLLTTCSLQESITIKKSLKTFLDALNNAIAMGPQLYSAVHNVIGHIERLLLSKYTPTIWELDLNDLIHRFKGQYKGIRKYIYYLSYSKSLRHIRRCCLTSPKTDGKSVIGDLRLALLVQLGCYCFQVKVGGLNGTSNTSNDLSFGMLTSLVALARNCLAATSDLEQCSFAVNLEDYLHQDTRELVQKCEEIIQVLSSSMKYMESLFPVENLPADEQILQNMRSRIKLLCERLPDLGPLLDIEHSIKELQNEGLGEFITECMKRKVRAKDLRPTFEKQFYRLWLDDIYQTDPILHTFNSGLHEQTIDEFRKLDRQLIRTTPRRIINMLRSGRPSVEFTSPRTSDIGILQKEIQKKKRHMPLRRLFSDIPALIQALKPCFLMSPLSVASYLAPGQIEFDVLLFDEASQIIPEDAIGSIVRSPQVIVVGDTKQLPPTRFFTTLEEDDEDEDPANEPILESIMEQALAAGLREKSLLWHYRSRDESLIAFSNYYFYNNRLITFPSAGTYKYPTGMEFVLTPNGIYDRSKSRTNRREAQQVADLVFSHYKNFPDRSLGVVAFSLSQSDAINAAVEGIRQTDSGFDEWCNAKTDEHFFVKNLENAQGDERDVMFFSIGYGPDERGQITMNFGPLNREEGKRRLNVAITRAREHVKLISSFEPSQLDTTKIRAEGVRLLKEYMEVAKHGIAAIPRAITSMEGESESPFEEEVYKALIANGLNVNKQIGVCGYRIDLGILDSIHPGRFILGIECDGATYHSFKTARDRDRLRHQVLVGLGWRIHRIWSRDWVQNRQGEIDRVLDAIKEAYVALDMHEMDPNSHASDCQAENIQEGVTSTDIIDIQSETSKIESEIKVDNSVQHVIEYRRTPITNLRQPSLFGYDTNAIVEVLTLVVLDEGPIHKMEAARRVAAKWQLGRAGNRIQERIDHIARSSCPLISVRGDFYWLKNMHEPPVRRPAHGDKARPIERIALEEIEQAAIIVIKRYFGMTIDDLIRETARLLGHDRTGNNVHSRIESAIDRLLKRGVIQTNQGRISIT